MTNETPVAALAAGFDRPLSAELISDRRGSRAWKVTAEGGVHLALKANAPDDAADGRDKAAELAQASAILATSAGTHIQAAPAVDIWGLGASLCWCWTGYRPVRYLDEVDRAEKLQAIAAGHTVALDTVRPWSFPAFEDLITACLAPDPTDRPTASDLVAQLEKVPA
jgi:hypothetical protein